MLTWSFQASPPYRAYGRWWFAIEGRERRCHGPFGSERAALAAREHLFARWVGRATAVGGDCLRLSDAVWVVRLPADHPCGGVPFQGQAVAVAAAHAPSGEPQPAPSDRPVESCSPSDAPKATCIGEKP